MKKIYSSPDMKQLAIFTEDVISASREEPVIEDIGGNELAVSADFIF